MRKIQSLAQKSIIALQITSVIVFMSFTSNKASAAAFIIEPGIGYKQEIIKLTDKNTKLVTQLSSGTPVASLKFHLYSSTGVSISLAGEYSKGQTEHEPLVEPKPEFNHFIGSFQLGVSAMDSMKIYLGYAPVNNFETQTSTSFTGFKLKGLTYIAGIALYPYRRFGLNFQYNMSTYSEISGKNYGLGTDTALYYEKIDSQDFSAVLSYMF